MPTRPRRVLVPFAPFVQGRRTSGVFLVGLIVGASGGVSCKSTIANTDHCFYNAGNETCAERYGGDLPYCATVCAGKDDNPPSPNDDGCVDWQPDEGCYSPCGGENDVADDATCLGVADTGSTSSMTTSATSTTTVDPTSDTSATTPIACMSNDECTDPEAPICVDDECRPCGDAALPDEACAMRDEALSVCGATGACVECSDVDASACAENTPVCGADGMCRGCTDHGECTAVCDLLTGACFPDTCDRDVPGQNSSVQQALDVYADEEYCIIRITDESNASFVVDGAVKRAIVSDGVLPWTLSGSVEPTLRAQSGAVVYVHGVRFSGNAAGAIESAGAGARVYLDEVEVRQNPGSAIRILTGSHLQMRNTIVGRNGNGGGTPGIRLFEGSADILYSTIVDNDAMEADSIECDDDSVVTVRNSIVMSTDGQSIDCAADITFTAVDENFPGTGTEDMSPLNLSWFANQIAANFRLSANGAAVLGTIARWTDGDPPRDIDGDARVGVDGESEAPGADVLPP